MFLFIEFDFKRFEHMTVMDLLLSQCISVQ